MTEVEAFRRRVVIDQERGCLLWCGSMSRNGYGWFWFHGKRVAAHRWAWVAANGPIPEGLQTDHLCRIRRCVNDAHMELVTPQENTRRGFNPMAINARKTTCPLGHEYDLHRPPTNGHPNGGRRCRKCLNESNRKYRERQRNADAMNP